jgi:hypothetical protein
MTNGVTCAAASVEQLAWRGLRFRLELRPPVTKGPQRETLHLAIFTLIQVAALPRFMMHPQNAST